MSVCNRKVLGPATSTRFLGCPLSRSKRREVPQADSCYWVRLVRASTFKFIKIRPLCCQNQQIMFPNSILLQRTGTPRLLSQASASNLPNVFTSRPPSLEGREGEAWEPSNNMALFPTPQTEVSFSFQNHRVSGLCLSPGILETRKHNVSEIDPVSETLCFLVSTIPNGGQSPKTH
jgi:hypothetical protein